MARNTLDGAFYAIPTAKQDPNLTGRSKSLLSSGSGFSSFFFAIPCWRGGLQCLEQSNGARRNFVDCCMERRFVRARRLVESGNLSYELDRCIPNFIGSNGWVEVEKVLYVSAHIAILMLRRRDRHRYFQPQNRVRISTSRARAIARAWQIVIILTGKKPTEDVQSQVVTIIPSRFPLGNDD